MMDSPLSSAAKKSGSSRQDQTPTEQATTRPRSKRPCGREARASDSTNDGPSRADAAQSSRRDRINDGHAASATSGNHGGGNTSDDSEDQSSSEESAAQSVTSSAASSSSRRRRTVQPPGVPNSLAGHSTAAGSSPAGLMDQLTAQTSRKSVASSSRSKTSRNSQRSGGTAISSETTTGTESDSSAEDSDSGAALASPGPGPSTSARARARPSLAEEGLESSVASDESGDSSEDDENESEAEDEPTRTATSNPPAAAETARILQRHDHKSSPERSESGLIVSNGKSPPKLAEDVGADDTVCRAPKDSEDQQDTNEGRQEKGAGAANGKSAGSGMTSADEDDEDEDEDDEDDGEEEEPTLKYSRLGSSVAEILAKDTVSSFASSATFIALGTHNGMVHLLTHEGAGVRSYRPHSATVSDLVIDEAGEFVATASVEGRAVVHAVTGSEAYAVDLHRPLKAVALEPGFARKPSSRAFVAGGLAETLTLHEKGWLGSHKSRVLQPAGEGAIHAVRWRGQLIVWATDNGIRIFDTATDQRVGRIDRPTGSPRADLFKCTLLWRDDTTLIAAWADHVQIVKIRQKQRPSPTAGLAVGITAPASWTIEIVSVLRVDCMLSGIATFSGDGAAPNAAVDSLLVLAYVAPDTFENEATDDPAEQRRKAARRPELRLISPQGEELSSDALGLADFHRYGCNDYSLVASTQRTTQKSKAFYVVSPRDVIVARPRDAVDHIDWLVEQERFADALAAAEKLVDTDGRRPDVHAIGLRYIRHLFDGSRFDEAAALCPRVLGQDAESWEHWFFLFVQHRQIQAILSYLPVQKPRLSRLVYDMALAHFLANDKATLLRTLRDWPLEVYDVNAVVIAIQGELERSPRPEDSRALMESLAEIHVAQHQPAKALPYLLRIRRPDVFDFVREHNLFSAVQDQVQLLVDFDAESGGADRAIALLVDHTHAIPIERVVSQLSAKPRHLYMYLEALFRKDPQLTSDYADQQVSLGAEYDPDRLLDFLRASNYYSLEQAYRECRQRDLVPEMVFLLGRMGDNKRALTLIIERLGDVRKAIDFAKEQADEELWEDLLRYSQDKPTFIRALLENVGGEIDPLRVIRRIAHGLEIPGLKSALVTILQASNLQVSLLEGCRRILFSDAGALAKRQHEGQTTGEYGTALATCHVCDRTLYRLDATTPGDIDVGGADAPACPVIVIYLCRHAVHATCAMNDPSLSLDAADLPLARPETLTNFLISDASARGKSRMAAKNLGAKLAYAAMLRVRLRPCPVCHEKAT